MPRNHAYVTAQLTASRVSRSAAMWGAIFSVYVAGSAYGYAASYPDTAQRIRLASVFGSNAGINAIIGPAHGIDTVAGFTAWRSLGVLSLVGAVWGLLTSTRQLRGEEEAGRWELLLAGPTTRRSTTAQALAGLAVGAVVLWALPALTTVLIGRSHTINFTMSSALFLALALACSAAMFGSIGALAGQVASTRRQAAAVSAGVLGGSFALRMVADADSGLSWLRWGSPLGWIEELRPMGGSQPLALAPIAVLILACAVATVAIAGRRDLGAGSLPDRATAHPRVRLLTGPLGLAVRLSWGTITAWVLAIGVGGLLMGLISKSAGEAIETSTGFADTLHRLGSRGLGAQAFLGVAFLMITLVVSLVGAAQIASVRDEEATARVDHLLVRPVSRRTWLLGRIAIAMAAVALAGCAAAMGAWAGAATQDAGVSFARMAEAGVNVMAPALLILGFGVCVFGLWPRASVPATYGLIAWSFLLLIIGSLLNASHWLLDTSVFKHMAGAPAVTPDWRADAVLVLLGVSAAAVGVIAFHRRDLAGQ